MSNENKMREKAHEAIRAGKLPNRRPDRMWGGPGAGAACTICDAPVKDNELELEIEFGRTDLRAARDRYRVHVRCFAAWEVELDQARSAAPAVLAAGPPDSESGSTVSRRVLPDLPDACKMAASGHNKTYNRGPT